MKKSKAVLEAEAAVIAKAAELEEARKTVTLIESELSAARLDVIAAQTAADAELPQCRIVRFRGGSSTMTDIGQAVILRRTPRGILVVRKVGDASNEELRFKWDAYPGAFQRKAGSSYATAFYELSDVPAEYLPSDQAT